MANSGFSYFMLITKLKYSIVSRQCVGGQVNGGRRRPHAVTQRLRRASGNILSRPGSGIVELNNVKEIKQLEREIYEEKEINNATENEATAKFTIKILHTQNHVIGYRLEKYDHVCQRLECVRDEKSKVDEHVKVLVERDIQRETSCDLRKENLKLTEMLTCYRQEITSLKNQSISK